MAINSSVGLTCGQARLKRIFDFGLALVGLSVSWWLILLGWLVATVDTQSNGFFLQKRIGRNGYPFYVIKIRTMCPSVLNTTVTTAMDPRITPIGRFLRKSKIDELPQLINVLFGQMSFVGPRPDVPGFADELKGEDRFLLSIRPGITGPATLKYRNEEDILANVDDPESYNRDVLYPEKVRINLEYIRNWSFFRDIEYIWQTVVG